MDTESEALQTTETSSPAEGGTAGLASEEGLADASGMHWGLARTAKNGLSYLEYLKIEENDTGASVFKRLKIVCDSPVLSHERTTWSIWRPTFHLLTVYKAKVVEAPNSRPDADVEAQSLCEVFVMEKKRSSAYTEALRNPSFLETAPNFIGNRAEYNLTPTSARDTIKTNSFPVLLVVREIDRIKVLLAFLGLCVLSVGVGCAVGRSTHEAAWGIGVASGMFGFLAILQTFCVWASG